MRRRNLTKLQMQQLTDAYTDYLLNCNTHMWITKQTMGQNIGCS